MNWPRNLAFAMEWLWFFSGVCCLFVAAAFLSRESIFIRAQKFSRGAWALVGAALPLLLAVFKYGQFRAFELMWDSGVTVNLAWNILHGYGIHSSVIGDTSYLAIHFAFAYGFLAPLLWICNSAVILALAQGALVGSTVFAGIALSSSNLSVSNLSAVRLPSIVVLSMFLYSGMGFILHLF